MVVFLDVFGLVFRAFLGLGVYDVPSGIVCLPLFRPRLKPLL